MQYSVCETAHQPALLSRLGPVVSDFVLSGISRDSAQGGLSWSILLITYTQVQEMNLITRMAWYAARYGSWVHCLLANAELIEESHAESQVLACRDLESLLEACSCMPNDK